MIIAYIIKFSLCLLLLLLFYKLVLENEKAHHFKRFFLLGGLFLSFTIPLLNFSFAIDRFADVSVLQMSEETKQIFIPKKEMALDAGPYLSAFLFLGLYLAGILFFGLRFIISLRKVVNQITAGKKMHFKEYILVLADDNIMHYSFLNYIFVNRKKYEKNQIPFEIIKHELVHIKQRHSLELLFVEILQIFLWFNPLIILYRSLVKRNHEFLADEGVLCQHSNPSRYAEILLNQTISFPNQPVISYFKDDLVRDRILMMTKDSSLKLLFIKLTGILPLLAISFFLFSNNSIAENAPAEFTVLQEFHETNAAVNKGKDIREVFYLDVVINANKDIFVQNLPLQRKELNPTIQKILSFSDIENHKIIVRIYAHGSLPVGFITDIENEIFRANSNIRTRKRFILEAFDTYLNSGWDWFQKKTSGSKDLNSADVFEGKKLE